MSAGHVQAYVIFLLMIGHPKNGSQLGGSNALVKHANHCINKGMMKLCDYN